MTYRNGERPGARGNGREPVRSERLGVKREEAMVRRQPTSQDDGSVRCLQLLVTEGAGGGLLWRKDFRALHLFKRGDRLQQVNSHA
jgi:hypothetical protein